MHNNHLRYVLRKYWGYSNFRPLQNEAVSQLIDGKDCCVIMATGSGKSLIYQLPSLALNEYGIKACSIVISPLISLMEDQIESLKVMGVSAGMLGGNTGAECDTKARRGDYTVLYISPEKAVGWKEGFLECQMNCRIACIAVDESHCVSEWGHDFRPAYRGLSAIRSWCSSSLATVPLVALTATATAQVLRDIVNNLDLISPFIFKTPFNRPNLHYSVRLRSGPSDLISLLADFKGFPYRNKSDDSSMPSVEIVFPATLIYVPSKNDAEELARELRSSQHLLGVGVAHYHAGMSGVQRSATQRAFALDEIQIVVATVAFGMGIHKPDIRLVVNYGIPSSVEAYYQQTGRAGRDGRPADCVLLYSHTDATRAFNLATYSNIHSGISQALMDERAASRVKAMTDYTHANGSSACRRNYLLEHFEDWEGVGDLQPIPRTDCCDLCDKALALIANSAEATSATASASTRPGRNSLPSEVWDVSREVHLLLQAVQDSGGGFGLGVPVGLLSGSHEKSLHRITGYSSKPSFGKGRARSKEWWMALGRHLASSGGGEVLQASMTRSFAAGLGGRGFVYERYSLTAKGKQVLQAGPTEPMRIAPSEEMLLLQKGARSMNSNPASTAPLLTTLPARATLSPVHRPLHPAASQSVRLDSATLLTTTQLLDLEGKLRGVRADVADRSGSTPYAVLSTADLKVLLQALPTQTSELTGLSGWGVWKIRAFGEDFVKCIRMFLNDHGITPDLSSGARENALTSTLIPTSSSSSSTASGSGSGCSITLYRPDYETSTHALDESPSCRADADCATEIAAPSKTETAHLDDTQSLLPAHVGCREASHAMPITPAALPQPPAAANSADGFSLMPTHHLTGLRAAQGTASAAWGGPDAAEEETERYGSVHIGSSASSATITANTSNPVNFVNCNVEADGASSSSVPPVKKARTMPRSLGLVTGPRTTGVKIKRDANAAQADALSLHCRTSTAARSQNAATPANLTMSLDDVKDTVFTTLSQNSNGLSFTDLLNKVTLRMWTSTPTSSHSMDQLSAAVLEALKDLRTQCRVYIAGDKYMVL